MSENKGLRFDFGIQMDSLQGSHASKILKLLFLSQTH